MILSSCGCKVSWALRGGTGNAASAEASAGFAVCSVYTNRKNRRGQQLICRQLLRIIFCPHPSQTLRIFRWGRGTRKVVLPTFLRDGRNDSDDCSDSIIFTVATVAAVAPSSFDYFVLYIVDCHTGEFHLSPGVFCSVLVLHMVLVQ